MENRELAPISVEPMSEEELASIPKLAKIKTDGGSLVSRADSLLGVASDVLEIAETSGLYKVTVPDGYCLQDLVPAAGDPDKVRALVKDANGHFNGDVSLSLSGISPTQVASVGLAAAAMIVGQAYMTEISDSLNSIDKKIDSVTAMLSSDKKATLTNALDVARNYARDYEEYQQKPPMALQAARNEIESRYNDVGQVIDWITNQLADVEKRAIDASAKEKEVSPLIDELLSYDQQFNLCLQTMSALAMTRMYYDGTMDEESAKREFSKIQTKSQGFLKKRQYLAGVLEIKIGSLRSAPIALPQAKEKGAQKGFLLQTPRAAAKENALQTKIGMQSNLRNAQAEIASTADSCREGIGRIAETARSSHTLLTDGTNCWLAIDGPTDLSD